MPSQPVKAWDWVAPIERVDKGLGYLQDRSWKYRIFCLVVFVFFFPTSPQKWLGLCWSPNHGFGWLYLGSFSANIGKTLLPHKHWSKLNKTLDLSRMFLCLRMQVKRVLLTLKHEAAERELIWVKFQYNLREKVVVTLEGNTIIKTDLPQQFELGMWQGQPHRPTSE